MIPRITKIKKNYKYYQYGFRWMVCLNGYSIATRNFARAYRHWIFELKKYIKQWFK